MDRTLLLNATYEPLLIVPWQKAITLAFLNKVEVLAHYEREVRSPSLTFRLPAVIRLLVRVKQRPATIRFSRTNIYARDDFQCQYCGDSPGTDALTYDHVIPRSRGGRTTWTNIVTCCSPCNRRKGNRTPREARMELVRKPIQPTWLPVVGRNPVPENSPEAWAPYLWRKAS